MLLKKILHIAFWIPHCTFLFVRRSIVSTRPQLMWLLYSVILMNLCSNLDALVQIEWNLSLASLAASLECPTSQWSYCMSTHSPHMQFDCLWNYGKTQMQFFNLTSNHCFHQFDFWFELNKITLEHLGKPDDSQWIKHLKTSTSVVKPWLCAKFKWFVQRKTIATFF